MEKIDVTGLPPKAKEYIESLERTGALQQRQIDHLNELVGKL